MASLSAARDAALDELRQVVMEVSSRETDVLTAEVRGAERIFVAGAGRSGLAIRGWAMRLMHLGLISFVVGDATTPAIQPGDLLVAASGSGRTPGILLIADAARAAGSRLASITSSPDSNLARMSDCTVVLPASTPRQDRAERSGKVESSQPLGSLFEQSLWVFLDIQIAMLKEDLGETEEALFSRHTNLE